MGKPTLVFKAWVKHQDNVRKKAGMKFSGAAPVRKLYSYYIIGDTAAATECYLFAHGGSFKDDYVLDNQSFTVPAGVTVEFYQPDNYMLRFTATHLRHGAPQKATGGFTDMSYSGGTSCINYILSKNQGRHQAGGFTNTDAAGWEMDYDGLQSVAEDQGVVVVSVRNRWSHAGVTLKDAIKEVRKAVPTITTFHCMFCRVREGYDDWAWAANQAGPGSAPGWGT